MPTTWNYRLREPSREKKLSHNKPAREELHDDVAEWLALGNKIEELDGPSEPSVQNRAGAARKDLPLGSL